MPFIGQKMMTVTEIEKEDKLESSVHLRARVCQAGGCHKVGTVNSRTPYTNKKSGNC